MGEGADVYKLHILEQIAIHIMTTFHLALKQLPEHGSCFLCGSENPYNLGLRWYVDEKGMVSSEFTLRILRYALRSGQALTLVRRGRAVTRTAFPPRRWMRVCWYNLKHAV